MLPLLIFLGIAVPTTELFLLVLISHYIGFWQTIGVIVVTGVLGALLWRWQGFGVFGRLRSGLTGGILPDANPDDQASAVSPIDALMDGAMIFFAGGLLLTPGVLTDLLGFALLIPVTRALFKKLIMAWLKRRFQLIDLSAQFQQMQFGAENQSSSEEEDIIEGEIISRSASGGHLDASKDSE